MGYIMSKCLRCNIDILDDSYICPLCNGVVESDKEVNKSVSVMYPDVEPKMKKIKFVIKLLVFLSVLTESVLILINYLTYNGIKWSVICGAAMAYMCFTVIYSFQRHTGHRTKLLMQLLGAMILVVVIDQFIGYSAWSVNYAIPIAIMIMDVIIIFLMFVNHSNWQNYIMLQIGVFVIGMIYMIFVFTDVVTKPLLTIIAVTVTGIILISTLVFGDKRAINEVLRRFRV